MDLPKAANWLTPLPAAGRARRYRPAANLSQRDHPPRSLYKVLMCADRGAQLVTARTQSGQSPHSASEDPTPGATPCMPRLLEAGRDLA